MGTGTFTTAELQWLAHLLRRVVPQGENETAACFMLADRIDQLLNQRKKGKTQ
jgi:alkyl sulfatase BDS1-like metallo-beta-lactamase superfamily hydrolase